MPRIFGGVAHCHAARYHRGMARKKVHTTRIILRFAPDDAARLARFAEAHLELRAEMMRDWILERLAAEEAREVERRIPKVKQMERVE